MNDDAEVSRLRDRMHQLANDLHIAMTELRAHVSGCTEQSKGVNAALIRLEAGQKKNDSAFNRFIMLVLGAQAAVLLAIFAAWLAKGGHI